MEYSQIYIHMSTVAILLDQPLKEIPCSLCHKTKVYGWQYNPKTKQLYCSKECAYKDTGTYFSTKQVTTLSKPRTSIGAERKYDEQIRLTRKIRLEAEELLDDII